MPQDLVPGIRKFVISESVIGDGAIAIAGHSARNLMAKRALLVTDPGILATEHVGRVCEQLELEGIAVTLFSGVSPNPRDHEVMAGVALGHDVGCDIIIVVGGGSPIDCAKGISIVLANGGHILDYEGVDKISRAGPPLICLPTTAGTSADVSQFAIITDTLRKVKVSIISKLVVPDLAIIDPRITVSMPPYLTACTGVDVMTHAFEALVSTAHWHLTDLLAIDAIRLVNSHLDTAVRQPENIDARTGMTLASMEAGYAFSNVSLGAVHAMAHSLGGMLDLPHGECNALLLEHVVRYNYATCGERYDRASAALGIDLRGLDASARRDRLVSALSALRTSVGVRGSLAERGVTPQHFRALAELAHRDPCILTNPRKASVADLEAIYGDAL